MKVRLEDIPEDGLEVAFEMRSAKPGDLGDMVEALPEPPRANLSLERKDEFVLARGRVRASLRLTCSRCLEPIDLAVDQDVDLVFEPLPAAGGEEVELQGDQLDVNFYKDDEVDLGEALLEEISFAVPMAPLCRPDCPGLCPSCGQPLKDGRCRCKINDSDPRWAKLAQLRRDAK